MKEDEENPTKLSIKVKETLYIKEKFTRMLTNRVIDKEDLDELQ